MYAKKSDANQPEVVERLRQLGLSVQPIHTVGKGVPDLLIGVAGWNFLIELKVSEKSTLTRDEKVWHEDWTGQVTICWQLSQVLYILIDRLELIEMTGRINEALFQLRRAWNQALETEAEQDALNKSSHNRRTKGRREVNRLPTPGKPS